MAVDFGDHAEAVGAHITQDALTQACRQAGDICIVIGFSPTPEQAETALDEHLSQGGGHRVLMDAIGGTRTPRSSRRRGAQRRR